MDVIKFVDSISATPTVRLDLNDGLAWGCNYEGTDFSPPPLKQAWSNTLLTDGERLSAAAYGNRTITLALDLLDGGGASTTEDFEDASFVFPISGVWARSTTQAFAGTWSLKAPATADSSFSDSVVTIPPGSTTMTLQYKVSSEAGFDFLIIFLDDDLNQTVLKTSGEVGWAPLVINVAGKSTVTFRYKKDSGGASGSDTAWIDNLGLGGQDGIAGQLQLLWRELNRPSNFLMYQPDGATNPVFFRTIRSSNTRVTDYPSGALRTVSVSIDAEPFGYGLKQQLSTVTITNDPASGANPMYFDVPSPLGDVETPLYMAIQGSSVVKLINAGDPPARPMSAIAVRRRGTPANTPFVLQGEQLEPLSFTAAIRDSGTVTMSVSGGSSPPLNANPLFEVNVANWTGTSCTLTRDTSQFNSGVASMKMTCAGGVAQAVAESEKITIDPTKLYGATAWVRIAVARPVDVAINWYTSGDVFISTSTIARATVSTLNTWVGIEHLGPGKPPPTAAKASMTVVLQGTPALNEVMYIDDAAIGVATHIRANNSDVTGSMKSVAQMALYPATPSVDARGTYRVFMRYRYSGGGPSDDIMCRLWWGNGVYNGNVVLKRASTTGLMYADLGLVNIPGGYDPVNDGVSGVEIPAEGVYINLQIQDTPGFTSASSLDIDHFLFFPADDRLLLALWQNRINAPAPTDVLLDSARGQVYSRNASGQPGMLTGHELAGGPPMVTPGVSNRVYFALDVGTELKAAPLGKNSTYTVAPHYWPRYLTVRPVSS